MEIPSGPIVNLKPRPSIGAQTILTALAALVAVGGVAFAVGRLTAPSAAASNGQTQTGTGLGAGNGFRNGNGNGNAFGQGNGNGLGQGGLGRFGGGVALEGQVTAVSDSSLTIQLPSGQTIDVPISSSTTYHRQAAAASGDVATGSQVQVRLGGPTASGAPASSAPSGSPGTGPRFGGTASDVTIVGP